MPPFRPSLLRLAESTTSATRTAAREALAKKQSARSFPVIPACPPSSCTCSETPQDLDIDRKTPLNGTMAAYNKHVLVLTGQNDWLSKVEDEQATSEWGKFTASLKKTFGRGGQFHDPYMNIPINACSFAQKQSKAKQAALLFPAFQAISIEQPWHDHIHDFASYIIDSSKNSSAAIRAGRITLPTILVCTHNGRDQRCGVLGPLLVKDFRNQIQARHDARLAGPVAMDETFDPLAVNVGGISHVGGHKWAGNVIVYVPPDCKIEGINGSPSSSPLAGKGIWYGRVEPKHVDGIITETILGGKVIQELFRGGIDQQGNPVRI